MLPMLIGAGLGVGKGLLDAEQAKRDRKREAEIQRWSPWTGLGASPVKEADYLGSAMQGGMAGAMVGQSLPKAAAAAPAVGGAATTANPGVAASLTGGQSQMTPGMEQQFPWLALK